MPRRRPWQHCLGATSSPVGPERRSPRRASDGRNGALMWPERSDVKEGCALAPTWTTLENGVRFNLSLVGGLHLRYRRLDCGYFSGRRYHP